MTRQRLLMVFLVTLIAAAGLFLFLSQYEQVEEEVSSGFSKRAQLNHFLAAEYFLKELEYPINSYNDNNKLDELLKSSGRNTIIIKYSAYLEARERLANIMSWMKQGGHLILELNSSLYPKEGKKKRGLLEFFKLSLESKAIFFEDVSKDPMNVQIYQGGTEFQARFLGRFSVETEEQNYTIKMGDENGTHLLEFDVGDGTFTVISDMSLWNNEHIGDFDHAALLAEILGKNPGNIDIVRAIVMPSLLQLIWENGKWFCISLALLLAFYIWSLFEKFGPDAVIIDSSRRSLIEHLDAAGKFDWRHFRGKNMLNAARKDLELHLDQKHPILQNKSEQERDIWIGEKTGIDPNDIHLALSDDCEHANQFLQAIQLIQKIRKQL